MVSYPVSCITVLVAMPSSIKVEGASQPQAVIPCT